jgi:ABC-type transport system involved in multi-copper enzyme maturation permease subunit
MRGFFPLAVEAVNDALRRRIIGVIVVVCILSVMVLDSCTACATGEVLVNDEPQSLAELAGYSGMIMVASLGLWIMTLAGVLAADHLRQTLEDGSAVLSLARPIGRATFAFARLAGVLGITWLTGAVLLGATGFLLASRGELDAAPVLLASALVAVGSLVVGSLSMATSLWLPQLPTILIVFAVVGLLALANGVGLVAEEGATGLLGVLDGFGPPLASALLAALAPWAEPATIEANLPLLAARLTLWAAGGVGLLALAFRRVELRS